MCSNDPWFRSSVYEVAGVVFAQQDYLPSEGLVALGAMLGLEVATGS